MATGQGVQRLKAHGRRIERKRGATHVLQQPGIGAHLTEQSMKLGHPAHGFDVFPQEVRAGLDV